MGMATIMTRVPQICDDCMWVNVDMFRNSPRLVIMPNIVTIGERTPSL